MKKIIFGLGLLLGTYSVHAQAPARWLDRVFVEKYYTSTAADSAVSAGVLPVGSVTYRVFIDMAAKYELTNQYGEPGHALIYKTTTSFFNNEDRGDIFPTYTKANAAANTVMLDSWVSVGQAAANNWGIEKLKDNGVATVAHPAGILTALSAPNQDGLLLKGAEQMLAPTLSPGLDLSVFGAISQAGNLFSSESASISALGGQRGLQPYGDNILLIGQFTTDGVFSFELNLIIQDSLGNSQRFVARDAVGTENFESTCMYTSAVAANIPPTVSITSPIPASSFLIGSSVALAANAADTDGTVASVEFFVDGVSVGVDNTTPYAANYVITAGSHSVTAKATDNLGLQTTSAAVAITGQSNPAPVVSITSPANNASFTVGAVVAIEANATDDVSVASVEFFVDNVSVGVDNSAPYAANYTTANGTHILKAIATDNLGAQGTSANVSISVAQNIPPTVSITSPASGASYTAPAVVTINASAADANGTVASVEFFVNNVSIGVDAAAPYTIDWTSVIGAASITAKATDNLGAQTTSSAVVLQIADPNALPYKIGTLKNTCLPSGFCLPVAAVDVVANVIGYDMVLQYNKNKVRPTGVITLNNALINPSYADVINSIDSVTGKITISAFLNSSAPASTKFNGVGNLFCVEFTKTASFNSVDTAVFTMPTFQESYFTGVVSKPVELGKYITYKDSTFTGSLKFWTNNSPIRYNAANPNQYLITNVYGTAANCSNKSVTAVQPDTLGNFVYNILNGSSVSIERDILPTTSVTPVINGADALLARRILLNDAGFNPSIYQMIAMDVNTDGTISAGDVSQINQRTILNFVEFKQTWNYSSNGTSNGQLSKDWLFVDTTLLVTPAYKKSLTFPLNDGVGYSKSRVPVVPFCLDIPVVGGASCPLITSETYKGILLGDVNGNYDAVPADGAIKKETIDATDKMILDLSKDVNGGKYIDIPVSMVSDENITALDFEMTFDLSKLKFDSVIERSKDSKFESAYYFNTNDKTLRFTSNSLNNYTKNAAVVLIRFTKLAASVGAKDFTSVKSYLNGDKAGVDVVETTVGIANIIAANMVTIYPNPATGLLNVEVAENATVQLLDVEGRRVMIQTNVKANQKQEINVENIANGVYMMKVYNNNFVSVKKVVINK